MEKIYHCNASQSERHGDEQEGAEHALRAASLPALDKEHMYDTEWQESDEKTA